MFVAGVAEVLKTEVDYSKVLVMGAEALAAEAILSRAQAAVAEATVTRIVGTSWVMLRRAAVDVQVSVQDIRLWC